MKGFPLTQLGLWTKFYVCHVFFFDFIFDIVFLIYFINSSNLCISALCTLAHLILIILGRLTSMLSLFYK